MTTETIEREAKLFQAGDYPDRGVEITEEDLDRIAAGTVDAPVRVEHTATPFDGALGVLKAVYRKGKELFGKLLFTRAAWELIKSANARRLSVAILKDKSAIAEVSLVREPRVADAAVFGSEEVVRMEDGQLCLDFGLPEPGPETQGGSEEVEKLQRELAEQRTERMIDELKRAGKIAPAAEVFARALLRQGNDAVITFGDQPTPISHIFKWFLESQPKVIEFAELANAGAEAEEPEVFAKLGVTADQVERYRQR